MGEWVAKALEYTGMSQAELARRLHERFGWNDDRSIINKITKGKRDISALEIMQIAEITGYPLPDSAGRRLDGASDADASNVISLRSDRARPLVNSFDPDHPDTAGAFGNAEDTAEMTGYTREHWEPRIDGALPEIDVKLGAGHGTVGNTIALPASEGAITGHRVVAEWLIPLDYLRSEVKAAPNQTIVLEVIGDSMAPTYMPGDRVLVDLSQDHLITDTVYAISYDHGEPQIKRLQRIPFSNPPRVKIISDNPNLETFEVDLSQLTIIGRICGRISRA